jgi:hypothetical protein
MKKFWSPKIISFFVEMTKITISNQSHKSYRKYKSENGLKQASEYIRGGIRCHGGVSIPCRPVAPDMRPKPNIKSVAKIM